MLDADHVVSVGVVAHEFDDLAGEDWRVPVLPRSAGQGPGPLPLSHLGLMPHRCRRICCTFGCSWSLRMTVCLASLSMPAWVRKALSLRPVSWPKVWSVPRQLYALPQIKILLNFGRTRSPGGSSHGIGELTSPASKTRRNASVDLICLCAGVLCLIDTRLDSLNCHYVNHSVRGFLPPARWRFSPTCFGPSRLRMRRIIRTQVVAPAIQSAPVATHSVATIAYLAFRLAGTILIPDCASPQRLSPALFPQLSPAPIYSSGRSRT